MSIWNRLVAAGKVNHFNWTVSLIDAGDKTRYGKVTVRSERIDPASLASAVRDKGEESLDVTPSGKVGDIKAVAAKGPLMVSCEAAAEAWAAELGISLPDTVKPGKIAERKAKDAADDKREDARAAKLAKAKDTANGQPAETAKV